MKKFNVLRATIYLLSNIILGLLEVILKIIYFLIPVGVYMALLQFREKASKVSAIGTFTEDDSTWQYIHRNFILVCINPKSIRKDIKGNVKRIDKWFDKYKSVIILGAIFLVIAALYLHFFVIK